MSHRGAIDRGDTRLAEARGGGAAAIVERRAARGAPPARRVAPPLERARRARLWGVVGHCQCDAAEPPRGGGGGDAQLDRVPWRRRKEAAAVVRTTQPIRGVGCQVILKRGTDGGHKWGNRGGHRWEL